MIILGLDQSQRATGHCILDTSTPLAKPRFGVVYGDPWFPASEAFLGHRIVSFRNWLLSMIRIHGVDGIGYEQTLYKKRDKREAMFPAQSMEVIILSVAAEHAMPCCRANITAWRCDFLDCTARDLTGRTRDDHKRAAVQRCNQLWQCEPRHDAAEAGGIARYTGRNLDPAYKSATDAAGFELTGG